MTPREALQAAAKVASDLARACEGDVRADVALVIHSRILAIEVPDEAAEAEFELIQDDQMVAGASGPREAAWREICHYAAVYSQDGPVSINEVIRKPVPLPAAPSPDSASEASQS